MFGARNIGRPVRAISRWGATATLASVVLASLGASSAFADPPIQSKVDKAPVNVMEVDAEHAPDVVAAARLAPDRKGHDHGWELRVTLRLKNHGRQSVTLVKVTVDTDVTEPAEEQITDDGTSFVITAGEDRRVHVPLTLSEREGPAPKKLGLKLHFADYSTPTVLTRPVALDENHSSTGGYRFPARAEDLPPDTYWSTGPKFHVHTREQRYAYDLNAVAYNPVAADWQGRWFDAAGTQADTTDNANWRIFGLPVYAMHSGTIVSCKRSVAENVPGERGSGGGNHFWVDHGNGEVALYAHLQEGSVPESLCPGDGTPDAVPIKVQAGDMLGRVGNTGDSSAPHLHVHVQDGPSSDASAEGVPLNFHHTKVQLRDGFDHEHDGEPHWADVHAATPAALGTKMLILPNSCGWFRYVPGSIEVAHHGVPASCWQDTVDAVEEAGYRMVFLDAFEAHGRVFFNGIFRPGTGESWAAVHDLTPAAYQAVVESHKSDGRRLLVAESYVQDGKVRYAAVFGPDDRPWTAYHGRTATEHQAQFDTLKAQGYHPLSVSVVTVAGQRRYTAVYEKSDVGSWTLDSTVKLADYQGVLDSETKAGRKPRYLNAYQHDGETWLSTIFWSAGPDVTALLELSSEQYEEARAANTAAGRRTHFVTGYTAGRPTRYAAAWEVPPVGRSGATGAVDRRP